MKISPKFLVYPINTRTAVVALAALMLGAASTSPTVAAEPVRWWVSTADLKQRLTEQPPLAWQATGRTRGSRIEVNPAETYQTMLGLGSSLEPSTCWNLSLMSVEDRERTMERLVDRERGIGMNLMRICIGTPDFTGDPWYSYNDLGPGETDPELKRFSIEKDRAYILPVLKLAKAKNPDLLFFASPWSPPGWMKSTGTMIGGHLLPRWYPVYAEYFVKFIQAYEAEGIPIYAVTIQNEPGVDRAKEKDPNWFYPSCHWTAAQERDFIRDHLGPAFRRYGLKTRIWCYDHNYNVRASGDDPGIAYPRTILSDPQAARFVDGVAFHGYAGGPSGMSTFHREFPNVPLYFTEGSVFGINGGVELIKRLRHHASAYNAWVTILDDNSKPNNGPFEASRTIITLNPATRKPTEHFDFFLYGQFMKFMQRGAVRVGSSAAGNSLANVAFRNPDGEFVLVLINLSDRETAFSLMAGDRTANARLPARSVATFVWAERKTSADASPRTPQASAIRRAIPVPLPEHPGNAFLQGESVAIPPLAEVGTEATPWRLLDDRQQVVRSGELSAAVAGRRESLSFGQLGVGWYRLEFGPAGTTNAPWTTLGVLRRLEAPVPLDSPISVDSAAAWFALNDFERQRKLANLASLAGVNWVRDRLRWRDIQPTPGDLKPEATTYDTSASVQREAGLQVLQVFHDTPPWAQEEPNTGGRFAPDLRHVYDLARQLAVRFKGRVVAWEPWNEANVATFGAHTVDQMCSWQKAAWLGFKAGDPDVIVGWNVTTTVPTPAHTEGLLANETWPYYDTYNIHTYDWSHAYAELWKPAREAAAGRPIWVTEADRGTPHLKNAPWFDQEPRLERLKAEWIAQAYASSLFAGAQQHFHFILGNYQEGNHIQFGLLRHDLTPRPAYVALAAVGRCLAGARVLGRWRPGDNVQVVAFRAEPDGKPRDVLVVWAEKEVDWDGRGQTTAQWSLPSGLEVQEVMDYLGRSLGKAFPAPLTSAPVFVFLPPGEALKLPLENPPLPSSWRAGSPSPVVLQLSLPRSVIRKVEDLPWSEGYVYQADTGRELELKFHVYNFAPEAITGQFQVVRRPDNWEVTLPSTTFQLPSRERQEVLGRLRISESAATRDGWVVLRADCGPQGQPVLAFRVMAKG